MQVAATRTKRKRVSKRPEDRIDDLIQAAMVVFRRQDFDSATVADIVDQAGVAKGTFYLYFKSKDDLLALTWNQYLDGLIQRAEVAATGPTWLNDLVETMIRFAVENADLHRLVYGSANAKALEMCRRANDTAIDKIAKRVEAMTEPNSLAPLDVDSTVRMIYHGTHGLMHDLMARDRNVDIDRTVALSQEFARRLITPVPAS